MDNNDKNQAHCSYLDTSDTTIQGETMWQFGTVDGFVKGPGAWAATGAARSWPLRFPDAGGPLSRCFTTFHHVQPSSSTGKLRAFIPLFSGHSTPDADAGCIPRRGTHVTLVRRNPTSFGNTLHRASHTSDPLMSASHCRMVSIFQDWKKVGWGGFICRQSVFLGMFHPQLIELDLSGGAATAKGGG